MLILAYELLFKKQKLNVNEILKGVKTDEKINNCEACDSGFDSVNFVSLFLEYRRRRNKGKSWSHWCIWSTWPYWSDWSDWRY
jgi:hypothetical protein